jgi:hypothetical protein
MSPFCRPGKHEVEVTTLAILQLKDSCLFWVLSQRAHYFGKVAQKYQSFDDLKDSLGIVTSANLYEMLSSTRSISKLITPYAIMLRWLSQWRK